MPSDGRYRAQRQGHDRFRRWWAVAATAQAWIEGVVRARAPRRLPVVLAREEVHSVLQQMRGMPKLIALLLYGAGLRLLEGCRLRVKDVDFASSQVLVREGKGDKDRVTLLPSSTKADLARHLEAVRHQHQEGLRRGAGWVELPGALARKYPNAGREWGWQWVFPATRTYVDPTTGQRRRHHLHETVAQRAVKEAVRRPGSPSRRAATRSDTPSRPTCWRMATTSGPSRDSWGTGISTRP
jgi:integrase